MRYFLRFTSLVFICHFALILIAHIAGYFYPYGDVLYTAKLDTHDELRLFDLNTGLALPLAQAGSFGTVDVSSAGDILITTQISIGSILNLLNPMTGELTDWVHGVHDNPVWSPNGKQVAYRRYYFGGGIQIATEGEWPPHSTEVGATGITWAPDGSRLAYASWNMETNQEEIQSIQPEADTPTELIAVWGKPVHYMDWSPDGTTIAIVTTSNEFYLLDVATQTFTENPYTTQPIIAPRWSPDNQFLLYMTQREEHSMIAVTNIATHETRNFNAPDLNRNSRVVWWLAK